ncbi:MAG TPA: HAMP domain-containing sensor histidine kinase [Solirubrobacteraceae bacterium]|nr:HAMP domain-containing sensor histidine kinase [Solirubrobacteraceae bacterium]
MIGLSVSGWLAASGAGFAAAAVWRVLAGRMESVARACHELRGPLTAARLGLQLGASTGELSPARLRAIDLELGRAALALEDLDSAGRWGPPATPAWRPLAPVDMRQLVADSVEARLTAAAAQDVELRMSWSGGSPAVWGDRLRLAQAIGNLIANAIEHGGGEVSVQGRGGPGRVRIEVIDDGPGLPAPVSELARRPHAGRGRRGRGLAIATAIITRHGGRLAAAPCARGTRLVVELPASRAGGQS